MPGIVALRRQFEALSDEVKNHFVKLRALLDNADLEIALAYIFMLLEQGRYRTVKCVLVRELKCPADLVDEMYKDYEFQRRSFQKTLSDLLGIDLRTPPYNTLEAAEAVRDKTLHGRKPTDEQLREGISNALAFVESFGSKVKEKTGKNPFGDLRGLSSRMRMLSKDQAKWVIKGVKMSAETK